MVPIETGKNKDYLEQFNAFCQRKINEGNWVCIFAEGQISRNGHLLGFKKGLEHIGKGIGENPIIPIHIDGLLGTPLSYDNIQKKTNKFKRTHLFKKIRVRIGRPLPSNTKSFQVRQCVKDLEVMNFSDRILMKENVFHKMLERKNLLNDKILLHGKTGEVLWREIDQYIQQLQTPLASYTVVGINVKDKVKAILLNIACMALQKTVVNAKKGKGEDGSEWLNSGVEIVLNEEQMKFNHLNIDQLDYLNKKELVLKETLKETPLVRYCLGEKGLVTFSHQNILANLHAIKQLFPVNSEMKIYSEYGLDHPIGHFLYISSFVTGTQILLEDEIDQANVILGKTMFVNEVVDRINEEQIKLFFVLDHEIKTLSEKITIEKVFRGLTAHTLCPIIALNSPNYEGKSLEGKKIIQTANSTKSLGRPLPGINIKVMSDSGEDLGIDKMGNIFAKGILLGEKGWIDISSKGSISEEGFLSIIA